MNHVGDSSSRRPGGARRFWLRARPFVFASLMVGAAAATAPVLQRLPHANLSLLFMTGVLIVAVRHGLWPSIYASVLSFLVFNFLFTEPRYTFKVGAEGDVATLVFFLLVASLTGNLAARMRDAMSKREKAMARTGALQALTRKVAGAATREEVLQILVDQLARNFSCRVAAAVADPKTRATSLTVGGKGPAGPIDPDRLLAASPALAGWTTLPLRTGAGRIGAVAIDRPLLNRDESEYATALTEQAAVALERAMLVSDLEQARLESQRQELRVALLSSVSHDLRTPLSSVIGAASSLLACASLAAASRDVLLRSILEEAERLDRYIQNLLDMTRLGQGQLESRRDWEDLRDLVSAASRRLRLTSRAVRLELDVAADAELVYVHGDLIEQVFVNLLDNAARYSPEHGRIRVTARRHADAIVIEMTDEGPGIPEPDREKVFDPFHRVRERDRKSGTGLGLSICRGIVAAHGGEVTAHANHEGRGTLIRVSLPQLAAGAAGRSND